jgi:predicted metalloenzyme YecM
LGEDCEYEIVKNIHEKLNDIMEEHKMKEVPEPLTLDKTEVKTLFTDSGVEEEKLTDFDKNYEKMAGENVSLLAANLINTRSFEVKTPDVIVKVNPEHADLVQTKIVDGRKCLVIEISDQVEVNGISVKTIG